MEHNINILSKYFKNLSRKKVLKLKVLQIFYSFFGILMLKPMLTIIQVEIMIQKKIKITNDQAMAQYSDCMKLEVQGAPRPSFQLLRRAGGPFGPATALRAVQGAFGPLLSTSIQKYTLQLLFGHLIYPQLGSLGALIENSEMIV